MAYYKILNITDRLNRRHARANSELIIDYKEGFQNKKYTLKQNEEIVIICNAIPTGIQNLSMKEFVIVTQITFAEYNKKVNANVVALANKKAPEEVEPSKVVAEKKVKKPRTTKAPKVTTTTVAPKGE